MVAWTASNPSRPRGSPAQKCPWDVSATHATAENGQLDCLKYLHKQSCPWDFLSTKEAIMCHLDVMGPDYRQSLREQGCPWGVDVAGKVATVFDHLDCLKYTDLCMREQELGGVAQLLERKHSPAP